MTKNHFLSLYQYNTWANNTILNHLKQLPEGIIRSQVKSVFPSIFDILMHVYIIDQGWYSVLTKAYRSDDYQTIKTTVDRLVSEVKDLGLEDFTKKQQNLAINLETFIPGNDMGYMDTFSGVQMTYGDVVTHMVNHGTYHRGNVTAMLHQLGEKGVPTDYGVYLYYTSRQ
ncbi:putative damage-inducible protein DinB [Pedobacter sp. AK017]|uniref:DinB family protein n=1 Tax=Pedobacter sp. AK017 TaxID=2723073 RepID=UPI001614B499|nr:DinB family protein [Pedobacter sp. AK017]MBB5437809.1 putative damage-inducible protein DinB [Pedobacter sp. AK017]